MLKKKKQDVLAVYDRQVDTVYRICYSFMQNKDDAEDLTQETFLKLLTYAPVFEDQRHERAWLIVTASNLCKDALKKWWRKNENIDDYPNLTQPEQERDYDVLNAILALPEDYKTAVYMYYYEGYSTAEIARQEGCPESTIRSRLFRARKLLKTMLGGAKS